MQDSAATVPAWLAVVLLLIGAAVPIVTQRLQAAADRRAREDEGERLDELGRRERQRLALYELQDSLTHLATLFGVHAAPPNPLEEPPPIDTAALIAAVHKIIALAVRVQDDQVRALTQQAAALYTRGLALTDETRGQWTKDSGDLTGKLHQRIGELLQQLDQTPSTH